MTFGSKLGEGSCITDSNETVDHYLDKCLGHKVSRDRKRPSHLEFNLGIAIADQRDTVDGRWYIYEYQNDMNKKLLKAKTENLMKNSMVEDVIIVPVSKPTDTIQQRLKRLRRELI